MQPRRHDLAALTRGVLDPRSNYCFGEGGAGTFSDGKLYTRAKDRARRRGGAARIWSRFGAPTRDPDRVAPARRLQPAAEGADRAARRISSAPASTTASRPRSSACASRAAACARVRLRGGDELAADAVVLAVGHSARAVYEWAARAASPSSARRSRSACASSTRSRSSTDPIRRRRRPPAAAARVLRAARRAARRARRLQLLHVPGRLDCPRGDRGGRRRRQRHEPVAARLAVRQRRASSSPSSRADFGPGGDGPLAGIAFQRAIEQRAFRAGGGGFRAPAQRLADFLQGGRSGRRARRLELSARASRRPTCATVLPPFVARGAARRACARSRRASPASWTRRAQLVGAETRTSAPVRIVRDAVTLQSPSLARPLSGGRGRRATRAASSAPRSTARASRIGSSPPARDGERCRSALGLLQVAQHLPQPRALLGRDGREAHAAGVAAVVGLAGPGDAPLDPQRGRLVLQIVDDQEQAEGDLLRPRSAAGRCRGRRPLRTNRASSR